MPTTTQLQKDQDVYVALPLSHDDHDEEVAKATTPAERYEYPWFCNHMIVFAILIALTIAAMCLEGQHASCHRHYHHCHHYRHRHPTKLAGGGRDWLVNAFRGTIHAKHDPSLVLGVDIDYPLILVRKDSPKALNFRRPNKYEGAYLPFHALHDGFTILTSKQRHVGASLIKGTRVSAYSNDNDQAFVFYEENNLIVLEKSLSASKHRKMVLDVSDWSLVKGTLVNFVEAFDWESRKNIGGGRDFTWNDDGRIATKLNPNLVLGRGAPKLVLVNEESPNKIVLEDAQALADGEAVPMTLANGGAVTKRHKDPREYGPWHYIESQVVGTTDAAVSIRYDGNYIFVDGNDDLVLDVAFWDMKPGTPVNFVGGDDDDTTKAGDQGMSHLRSSTLPTLERSKDSSESSSSSSDSNLSISSNSAASSTIGLSDSSNISGSGKSSFDVVAGEEEEIVLVASNIAV